MCGARQQEWQAARSACKFGTSHRRARIGIEGDRRRFARTGTDSMREALNILGFGPCHHMYELDDPGQRRLWRAVAKGADPDWGRLFQGYASCVDFPSVYYWRQLIEVFPDAKVILTWRPIDRWWSSYERSIAQFLRNSPDPDSVAVTLVANKALAGRPFDRDHVVATYERHFEEVRSTVPPERLLVYELGDGWEPLCRHLGVAVPDRPYPHRNAASEFQSRNLGDPASEGGASSE